MAEEEADEPVEEVEEATGSEVPPKKSKGLLFAILGALLAGGGGGAWFFLGNSNTPAPIAATADQTAPAGGENTPQPNEGAPGADAAVASQEATEAPDPQNRMEFGSTHTFKPFHLNLGNPLENRFVRLEIAIEYGGGEEQKLEIEKRIPQLRDAIISVTQRKTMEFLLGPDGKDQLRLEILNRINQYMNQKVDAVYLTDIIIE